MTGRTHDLAALAALAAVVSVNTPPSINLSTLLLALLANQIGGLFPDVDQPTAPFWRNLPIGNIFGKMFGRLAGGHRFITHSLIGVFLTGFALRAVLGFLTPILGHADTGFIWWAFMIGMLSHLFMDMLTKEGVPLLLPIPLHFGIPPLKALRITTGKWLEKLVVFPILLAVCVGLFVLNRSAFIQLFHRIS